MKLFIYFIPIIFHLRNHYKFFLYESHCLIQKNQNYFIIFIKLKNYFIITLKILIN